MAQAQLIFGGLTICDPSNNKDGYNTPELGTPDVDSRDAVIPGAAGRIQVITSTAGTEQSSLKLSFEGMSYFATSAALDAWLTQCAAAQSDSRNNLQTLRYGWLNDSSSFTKASCKLKFRLSKVERNGASGYFRALWNATFEQYLNE